MNVGQLIELLSGFDEDMEVEFGYNYGDHWNTTVAQKVDEVEEAEVTHSDYHRMDKVVYDDGEGQRHRHDVRKVVLLR